MHNKQKAQALWAYALDTGRPLDERQAARTELQALRKTAKTSAAKLLGVEQEMVDHAWKNLDALGEAQTKAQKVVDDAFEMPQSELAGQKPRQELERDPLDEAPHVKTSSEHTITLEEVDPKVAAAVKQTLGEQAKHAKKAKERAEGDLRGLISEMSRKLLLETDDPYQAIVDAIKAKHPHAVTTTRSLASVASEMRAKGEKVPQRRKPAKAKE